MYITLLIEGPKLSLRKINPASILAAWPICIAAHPTLKPSDAKEPTTSPTAASDYTSAI